MVVYRGSDALYGWVFDSLQGLGLSLAAISLVSLPVVAGWLVLSLALGRTHENRAVTLALTAVSREYRMINTTRRAFGILAAAAFATRPSFGQTENPL